MRRETVDEINAFIPPARYPSPFSTPMIAVAVTAMIGISAFYAGHIRGNIFEELERDYRISDFEYLVSHSTLEDSFQESAWKYTVVAPTDAAFDKIPMQADASVSREPADRSRYQDISAYDYVLSTPVYPEDVKFGEHVRIPSLSGHDLVFSRVSGGEQGLRVNGLPVSTVRFADNGVIYFIDDILPVPAQQQQLTWIESATR